MYFCLFCVCFLYIFYFFQIHRKVCILNLAQALKRNTTPTFACYQRLLSTPTQGGGMMPGFFVNIIFLVPWRYALLADYDAYIKAQDAVNALYAVSAAPATCAIPCWNIPSPH